MKCLDCGAPGRIHDIRKKKGYVKKSYDCANSKCRKRFTTVTEDGQPEKYARYGYIFIESTTGTQSKLA